jgi:hypothetical protein
MKCDRWVLRASRDSQLLRMPNKFGICHSAITVYCRRDYKTGSISRTNFCHSIIALCGWGDFAFEAHSELGAQNVELREVCRARNERKRRHAHILDRAG